MYHIKYFHFRWERSSFDVALGGQGAGRPAGPGEQFGLAVVLVVGGRDHLVVVEKDTQT